MDDPRTLTRLIPWTLLVAMNVVLTPTAFLLFALDSPTPTLPNHELFALWGFLLVLVCPTLGFMANVSFSRAFELRDGPYALWGLVFTYTSLVAWGVVAIVAFWDPRRF